MAKPNFYRCSYWKDTEKICGFWIQHLSRPYNFNKVEIELPRRSFQKKRDIWPLQYEGWQNSSLPAILSMVDRKSQWIEPACQSWKRNTSATACNNVINSLSVKMVMAAPVHNTCILCIKFANIQYFNSNPN